MGKSAGGSSRAASTGGKRRGKRISPVPWGPEIEKWPPLMCEFVQTHDAAEVYSKGLDALGYPPTWVHTNGEASLVAKFIGDER